MSIPVDLNNSRLFQQLSLFTFSPRSPAPWTSGYPRKVEASGSTPSEHDAQAKAAGGLHSSLYVNLPGAHWIVTSYISTSMAILVCKMLTFMALWSNPLRGSCLVRHLRQARQRCTRSLQLKRIQSPAQQRTKKTTPSTPPIKTKAQPPANAGNACIFHLGS